MSKKDISTLIDWNKWTNDTLGISLEQQGAYFMLVRLYTQNDGAIDDNIIDIYRACGAVSRSEKRSLTFILKTFFLHEKNKYYHKHIEEELEKVRKISNKRSNAAKERWQNEHANAYANAYPQGYAHQPIGYIYNNKPNTTTAQARESFQWEIWELLNDNARFAAEHNSQGWDKDYLQKKYNEWINKPGRGFPRDLNKAFPQWCLNFTKGKPPI